MLVATLPAPLLISAESGLLSLRGENIEKVFGVASPGITYDIPVAAVQTYDDLLFIHQWLASGQDGGQFRSIALDSLSEIAEAVLSNYKAKNKDPRAAYMEVIEKTEWLIRAFRDLPGRNVLMTAKMEMNKDEATGMTRYGPSMPGAKLSQKLAHFFDEVFRIGISSQRMADGKFARFLQTQPDMQYDAKDRSGALEPYEFPHLSYLFQKIVVQPQH